MNTYPADHSRIENNISTGTYDIENPNNYACQGFPSIDYMIHGIDNDKEKIILKYRENEKYGEYLQDIIKEMDENTTEVVSSWSDFRSTFVNSYENTATSMFLPSFRNWFANSTIKIPFFAESPIKIIRAI